VLLARSMAGGAWATNGDTGVPRIALGPDVAKAHGLSVRHAFNGIVTADVNNMQLAALERAGVSFERVQVATILGKPGGGGGRTLPSTQVPYGIKMIYGSPSLTTSGVSGGAGVTVAVLDTGALVSHPDFTRANGSKVITGCVDFADRTYSQIEGQCADGHGHGTHVIGTVAAAGGADGKGIFGVAPQANIYAYRVATTGQRCYFLKVICIDFVHIYKIT